MSDVFVKTNKDGSLKTCKFCRRSVWFHQIKGRWYDVGGTVLHVESCPNRKKHYKDEAFNRAESDRQAKHTHS